MLTRVRLWNAGFLILLLIPVLFAPAQADDFQAGMGAYKRGDNAAAIRAWKPLAEAGHVEAQYQLGVIYAVDAAYYTEGAKWFRMAAQQGHPTAQYNLGVIYASGLGVPESFVQAYPWADLAAEQGFEVAVQLKESLENHMTAEQLGRARDLRDVLSHWVGDVTGPQAAEAVDFHTGWEAFARGDFDTAIRKWQPLAEQGFPREQFLVGVAYAENGNDAEAAKYYRMAAEQGHARAQNNLGSMYEDGRGVPQSDEKAEEWYLKAASQGLAEAQTNSGAMYAAGALGLKDDVKAYAWFAVAAAQGDAVAAHAKDIIAQRMTASEFCNQAKPLAERYWKTYVLPFRNGPERLPDDSDRVCM